MKTYNKINIIILLLSSLILACTKADEIGPNDKNNLILNFENRIDGTSLALNTGKYKNASNEDFTITTLNYFISNIILEKTDGSELKIEDKYFLVREADAASKILTLSDIPAGNYRNIKFTVGVDSLKSIADISLRNGVLDPASYGSDNMYWSWNSGYIFFKMEGISTLVPANAAGLNKFEYHIGGFGGKAAPAPSNITQISLPLAQNAEVRKTVAPEIHLFFDVKKVFDGKSSVKLAETKSIHSPAAGKPIAANYSNGFLVDHVHND